MPSNKYEKQRQRRQMARRAASYKQAKPRASRSQLNVTAAWVSIIVIAAMIIGLVLLVGNTSNNVPATNTSGSSLATPAMLAFSGIVTLIW